MLKERKIKGSIKFTSDSVPVSPNGFLVSIGKRELLLTFFWTPPEDPKVNHAISRTRLTRQIVKDLGEIFIKEYPKLEDAKKNIHKKS